MAPVAGDPVVQSVDRLAAAFEHLQKNVAAVAQHARDPKLRVVPAGLLHDGFDQPIGHRLGGAAGVQEANQHGPL